VLHPKIYEKIVHSYCTSRIKGLDTSKNLTTFNHWYSVLSDIPEKYLPDYAKTFIKEYEIQTTLQKLLK
jgi:hypothetical protein